MAGLDNILAFQESVTVASWQQWQAFSKQRKLAAWQLLVPADTPLFCRPAEELELIGW